MDAKYRPGFRTEEEIEIAKESVIRFNAFKAVSETQSLDSESVKHGWYKSKEESLLKKL